MNQTTITGVRTVAVPVADQDRALSFYVDVLGFDKRMDEPVEGAGFRWIEVAPPGADASIALTPPSDPARLGVDTGIRLAATDADREHRAMREAGVDVDDLLTWPGVPPMFSFRDPDGNTLYVVELTLP